MKTAFLIIIFFFSSASAQPPDCRFTVADAPNFLGLRLGMSPKEAKSVFGGKLKIKVKREGTFFQNYIDKEPPSFLPNVRALYLRFFDAKLYQIEIFYKPQPTKQTLTEFISRLDTRLNLPPDLWVNEYGQAALNCDGFSLVADNVLNPRVELTDEILRARFQASQ